MQQIPPPSDDAPPVLSSRSPSEDNQDGGADVQKPTAAEMEEHQRQYGAFTRQDAGATPGRVLSQQQQQQQQPPPKSILRARKASVTFGSPTVEEYAIDDSHSEHSASPGTRTEESGVDENDSQVAATDQAAAAAYQAAVLAQTMHAPHTASDPSQMLGGRAQPPPSVGHLGQMYGGRAAPSVVGGVGAAAVGGGGGGADGASSVSATVERARALVESTRYARPCFHVLFRTCESIHFHRVGSQGVLLLHSKDVQCLLTIVS